MLDSNTCNRFPVCKNISISNTWKHFNVSEQMIYIDYSIVGYINIEYILRRELLNTPTATLQRSEISANKYSW